MASRIVTASQNPNPHEVQAYLTTKGIAHRSAFQRTKFHPKRTREERESIGGRAMPPGPGNATSAGFRGGARVSGERVCNVRVEWWRSGCAVSSEERVGGVCFVQGLLLSYIAGPTRAGEQIYYVLADIKLTHAKYIPLLRQPHCFDPQSTSLCLPLCIHSASIIEQPKEHIRLVAERYGKQGLIR